MSNTATATNAATATATNAATATATATNAATATATNAATATATATATKAKSETVPFRASAMCAKLAKADTGAIIASMLVYPDGERVTPRMIGISKNDAITLTGKAATPETLIKGIAWLIAQAVYGNGSIDELCKGLSSQVAYAVRHGKVLTSGNSIDCITLKHVVMSSIEAFMSLPEKTKPAETADKAETVAAVAPVTAPDTGDIYGLALALGTARNYAQQFFDAADKLQIEVPKAMRDQIIGMTLAPTQAEKETAVAVAPVKAKRTKKQAIAA